MHDKTKFIYSLLHDTRLKDMKENLVLDFTYGRTPHITEMTNIEANLLVKHLQDIKESKVRAMRGKIIHLLCVYGMVLSNGKPDYNRINNFIQNIGSNNPRKKKLFTLSPTEMRKVLNQVDQMMIKTLNA